MSWCDEYIPCSHGVVASDICLLRSQNASVYHLNGHSLVLQIGKLINIMCLFGVCVYDNLDLFLQCCIEGLVTCVFLIL